MRRFATKQLVTLKKELTEFSKNERIFIFCAILCIFFICCGYAVVRPIANSLFIEHFGAQFFPYAWLALVPLNLLFVTIYNRLIPKWGSKRLCVALIAIVILLNCFFAAVYPIFPRLVFLFYMWKEIYVLLLFQLVWSVIHSNIKLSRAKYLYGVFFGVGGLGSMFGSSFPGFFAIAFGTETLLYLTLPIYALLLVSYFRMNHYCSGNPPDHGDVEKGGALHGFKLIYKSRFLIFALLIVLFMQMIAAITDFQLNDFLGKAYSDVDVRTQHAAQVMGIIHTLTVGLQFFGTYFLIQMIGFKRLHYLLPLLIATSALLLLFTPVLAIVSIGFITCKTLDFSIFGVIKEMLYVPLKPDEKFRAKAVIDIFAYRTSKALASLLILGTITFLSSEKLAWVTLTLSCLWVASVSYGLKEYNEQIRSQEA